MPHLSQNPSKIDSIPQTVAPPVSDLRKFKPKTVSSKADSRVAHAKDARRYKIALVISFTILAAVLIGGILLFR